MMTAQPQTSQEAALEYKRFTDVQIEALSAEVKALTGKEHHKDRHDKGRVIAELRTQSRYIDARRVAKGLPPVHGFFAGAHDSGGSGEAGLDLEQAAKTAAEVERALKELEPKVEKPPRVELPQKGLPEGIEDKLFEEWARRMAVLEMKVGPRETAADVDELQAIAQEVVDYKDRLHKACGYRNKDLKEDRRLQRLEDRLDALAAALLPEFAEPRPVPEPRDVTGASGVLVDAAELKSRAQQLAAKMVQEREELTGLSPSEAREVRKLLGEIVEIKASMTADGFTEHEQDRDDLVFSRMLRVSKLKRKEHHDKKHNQHRHRAKGSEELRSELDQLHNDLAALKRRLRDELGYSHKDLKHDAEVAEMEERLTALHKFGGA
mmetsp:Transcript_92629/g.271178  ORF Transcript_92629/g.271178 Transcript_92629/m.271178 type:complete len:379 (+) Transcript_92629:60-1196(+)